MKSEFSRMLDEIHGLHESPLIWDSLCDEVKAAIAGGSAYSFAKLKEDIHNKTIGDKKYEE